MIKLLLFLAPALAAAMAPVPEFLCPPSCKCEAALQIGTAVPVPAGINTPGSAGMTPMTGTYGSIAATVHWNGQGSGWGPSNGQCVKPFTVCAECGSVKCGYLLNLRVDIDFGQGLLPQGNPHTYQWALDIPNSPTVGDIDNSSGTGQEKQIDEDLPCDSGTKNFDLTVYKTDENPPVLLFHLNVAATCSDCDPASS